MKRKELLLVFFLAFSLFLVISSAFTTTNDYVIRGVISGGGSNITGEYILKIATGQSVTGIASKNFKICFGFFCLIAPMGENSMNFTGYLNYSSGEPVKNSLIIVTIKNETLGFEKSGTGETDDFGYFFIKIRNLPIVVMTSDLDVSIRVIGEVEAIYECRYDKETGLCG